MIYKTLFRSLVDCQESGGRCLQFLPDDPVTGRQGHLRHDQEGTRYVFRPTVARNRARRSALKQVVRTFFEGSAEQAVAALLDMSQSTLSEDDLDQLSGLVDKARKEGR